MNETLRIVTKEQLAEGFFIRYSDGRTVRREYEIVRKIGERYEVREPIVAAGLVAHAVNPNY